MPGGVVALDDLSRNAGNECRSSVAKGRGLPSIVAYMPLGRHVIFYKCSPEVILKKANCVAGVGRGEVTNLEDFKSRTLHWLCSNDSVD